MGAGSGSGAEAVSAKALFINLRGGSMSNLGGGCTGSFTLPFCEHVLCL